MTHSATTTATEIAADPRCLFTSNADLEYVLVTCRCGHNLRIEVGVATAYCWRCRAWTGLRWTFEPTPTTHQE